MQQPQNDRGLLPNNRNDRDRNAGNRIPEHEASDLQNRWALEAKNRTENERNITNLPVRKRPQITEQDDYSGGYESSEGDRQIDSGKYNKSRSKPDEKDMCVFTGDGSLVPCPEDYLKKRDKAREAYRKRKALLAKKGKRSARKSPGRKSPGRKRSARKSPGRKRSARKSPARKSPGRKRSARKRK